MAYRKGMIFAPVVVRAGLRMTALERRLGRFMRSEEGHGGEAGAGGGGEGGAGDGGAGSGEPQVSAAWYGALSADKVDDKTPSDADWMKNKNFTDPAAMVKSYRSLEARIGKGVEVPGEGATAEQIATFRKAIGVPENVDGYAMTVPEGWEADMALFGPLREVALAAGTPATAWQAMIDKATAKIMDDHNALVDTQNAELAEWKREAGAQADQNLIIAQRGFDAFGFSKDEIQAMQTSLGAGGTKKMMELGLKIGRLSGEDGFIQGKRDFGVSAADARSALQAFEKDGGKVTKLREKDQATIAEHSRLIEMVTAAEEAEKRQRDAA
ncbi:hypothetical protein [Sphingomonas sanguinis]|uniref:hypothetical protein n=1 Tax=Sphingomonas sanguinis TaxID=33051 RepID=UPI000ABF5C31|nr:hypothetical protein [Sphingomonas sanguinis]